jgi:nitrate/TMAO reductase-like tetraheme cytochrome c subunit
MYLRRGVHHHQTRPFESAVHRSNEFYFQFQKLANNYNQIVKVVNAHFSNIAIPHQIAMLEQQTRELKVLSIEILNPAKQAKEWLRI